MANLVPHDITIERPPEPLPPGVVPPYERYPLLMVHPAHLPASIGTPKLDSSGRPVAWEGGTAERYPPIQVQSPDDEEFYKSRGYEPAGKGDPAAWSRAHANPINIDSYKPVEYPKWVIDREVQSAEEEAAVRALHGHAAPVVPPAPEVAHVPYVPDSPALVETAAVQDSRIDALEEKVGSLHDMMAQLLAATQAGAGAVPKPRGRPPGARAQKPKRGHRKGGSVEKLAAEVDDEAA